MSENFLQPNYYFNFDNEIVCKEAERIGRGLPNKVEISKALYYEVRDGIKYNPYIIKEEKEQFKASHVLKEKVSYCTPKAVLLGAMARYWDIPSKLGLVDVKNHIATPQLLEWLGSNTVRMHGYINLFIDNIWVKATPAFNKELCVKLNVEPLEFSGKKDSLFQEFTKDNNQFMEYVKNHGEFETVPFDLIFTYLKKHHPNLNKLTKDNTDQSLEKDIKNKFK